MFKVKPNCLMPNAQCPWPNTMFGSIKPTRISVLLNTNTKWKDTNIQIQKYKCIRSTTIVKHIVCVHQVFSPNFYIQYQSNVYKQKVSRYEEMPCFVFAEKCAVRQKENWQFVEIGRHGQFNVSWNRKGIEHFFIWKISLVFFSICVVCRNGVECLLSMLRKLHLKLGILLMTLIRSKCWMCSFFWIGTIRNFRGEPNLGVAWISSPR